MTETIAPELVERMVALVREVRKGPPISCMTNGYYIPIHNALELFAIADALPKPIDPDLIEARRICADAAHSDEVMPFYINGQFDHQKNVKMVLTGIRRGKEIMRTLDQNGKCPSL